MIFRLPRFMPDSCSSLAMAISSTAVLSYGTVEAKKNDVHSGRGRRVADKLSVDRVGDQGSHWQVEVCNVTTTSPFSGPKPSHSRTPATTDDSVINILHDIGGVSSTGCLFLLNPLFWGALL